MGLVKYYYCYKCRKIYTSFTAQKHKTRIKAKYGYKNIKVPVCCNRSLRFITKEDHNKIMEEIKK